MTSRDARGVLAEALAEIRALRAKVESAERNRHEPIAIVGIGCRFPGGADSPDALWDLLERGHETISDLPSSRWSLFGPSGAAVRWGSFLPEVDRFDPLYFGISPREAVTMDPQQRLFLEVAVEALEGAGQPLAGLEKSRTGVFVGVCSNDYAQLLSRDPRRLDSHSATGVLSAVLSGRVSYCLGLEGPSLVVDTACSASLVALHLAVRSLRIRECDLAIAGGVNVILLDSSNQIVTHLQGGLAPDGRCKTFDASANGIVRGEGCGAVVLKRLSDALRDRDPIRAVVRGSAVNQDGRSTSLTAPNVLAQQAVIRDALRDAGVAPEVVGHVEAHGTGTSLGDPIEVEALTAVYGRPRDDGSRCTLGALKTNLGHTEAAAGIGGVIKTVLCLERGKIPPNLHFRALNPRISLEATPFVVPTGEAMPWAGPKGARLAAVSAFGIGGTNAHVVLEQAPPTGTLGASAPEERTTLVALSAKTESSLSALAMKWRALLERSDAHVADLAYSSTLRRTHHDHRLALVGRTREELLEELDVSSSGAISVRRSARAPKVAFVFSGQGGQWFGMARELLAEEPIFRESMERCDAAVREAVGWSLLEELAAEGERSRLRQMAVIQPVLFAVQVSLAALWRSYGVDPKAVVGHSLGEVAAAHVAGALRLEDAVKVVCLRSELLANLRGHGEMALVALSKEDAAEAIAGHRDEVSIAASNGPKTTVISGAPVALRAIKARLDERGVFCRIVNADGAGHSPQVDPLREELLRRLSVEPASTSLPFYSTVHGAQVSGESLDVTYWGDNMRRTVLFAPALEKLAADGIDVFVEIGPHPVLAASIRETLSALGVAEAVVPSMLRETSERRTLLRSLGDLFQLGVDVDFRSLFSSGEERVVPLPTYAWDHDAYFVERTTDEPPAPRGRVETGTHPLLGRHVPLALEPATHLFEAELDIERAPFLRDHRVLASLVFPGAGFVDLVWSAATRAFGSVAALEDVRFERLLTLKEGASKSLQVVLVRHSADRAAFHVAGLDDRSGFERHVSGVVRIGPRATTAFVDEPTGDAPARTLGESEYYETIARLGLSFGPTFRGIQMLAVTGARSIAEIRVPEGIASSLDAHAAHPALLDIFFQSMAGFVLDDLPADGSMDTLLPSKVHRIVLHERPHGATVRAAARLDAKDGAALTASVVASDADGRVVLEVEGFSIRRLGRDQLDDPLRPWLSTIAWPAAPASATPTAAVSTGGGRWLVLSDAPAMAAPLSAALAKGGALVEQVSLSVLDPGVAPEVAPWAQSGAAVRAIVLALGHGNPFVGDLSARAARLVALVASCQLPAPPRLYFVTRGAAPAGSAAISAEAVTAAQLHGLARTLAYEHPDLRPTVIDVDPTTGDADAAEGLARELLADDAETLVALRGSVRHVGRLAPAEVMPAREEIELPADATYLVTGGLGALGLELARYLATRGARSIVLAARREPGPEERQAIAEIQALGANVEAARVDVANADRVAELFERIDRTLPPVRGVFHLAVVLDDGAVANLDPDRIARVFAPKVRAAHHLHRLTVNRALDHFVLFSSAASVIGVPGQGSYAAANASLDALAEYRRALGLPAIAVNFGVFARAAGQTDRLVERGAKLIETPFALSSLGRLMKSPRLGAIGFFQLDLDRWGELYPSVKRTPFFGGRSVAEKAGAQAMSAFRDELRAVEPARRLAMIEVKIREEVGRVLRIPAARFERDRSWASYGIDSLMGLEVRNRLEATFGVVLPAIVLFAEPTLGALATHLASKLERDAAAPMVTPAGPAPSSDERDQPSLERRVENIERMSVGEANLALQRKLAALRGGKRSGA